MPFSLIVFIHQLYLSVPGYAQSGRTSEFGLCTISSLFTIIMDRRKELPSTCCSWASSFFYIASMLHLTFAKPNSHSTHQLFFTTLACAICAFEAMPHYSKSDATPQAEESSTSRVFQAYEIGLYGHLDYMVT